MRNLCAALLVLLFSAWLLAQDEPMPDTPKQAADKAERLHRLLDAIADNPNEKELGSLGVKIRALGGGYRDALGRAVLAGGRSFNVQLRLSLVLYGEPFHAREILYTAVDGDDPVVRRTAVLSILVRDRGGPEQRHKPLSDRTYGVIKGWCSEPADPNLYMVLTAMRYSRDPRLVELLLPILGAKPQDCTDDIKGIERVNKNRQHCAQVLGDYLPDEQVVRTFEEVVRREGGAAEVQFHVWKALASKGYAEDPEIYWIAARSENDYVRQVVAENLRFVEDSRVIPILRHLLEDRREVVRRGALDSLIEKKSPIVFVEPYYLAEDSYSSIKGDLAWAVWSYKAEEHIPFLIWCLDDNDPIVVEKALVTLFRLTRKHHGFTDQVWKAYVDPARSRDRRSLIRAFMDDEKRRNDALECWSREYPPRYRDRDRVPHLIRQLGHADRENVKRALMTLARVTGRSVGFPEVLLDPSASDKEKADALSRFMQEQRVAVIASWRSWYEAWNAK